MSGPQQFSLRWNNYSQHIVTAIEELRTDDEFTDVTLSCEGQRIKGHKMLLSACSSYFRETFKENPCKHPIIILKGVSFHDLEAVVQFMYNGQVNVSQDGLPSFLATAELLQIKGLTDMNDREDFPLSTKISNSVNKRMLAGILPQSHLQNQNSNSSLSHSASRSGTPDNVQQQRPPSPKRKRIIADNFDGGPSASSGAFASSSSSTPTQQPVMGSSGSNGPSASSSTAGNSGLTNQSPMLMSAVANAGTSLAGASQAEGSDPFNSNNVTIKYEEEGMQDEDDYDEKHNMSSEDNDNSIQDMMGHMEPGSLARSPVHVGYSATGDPVAYGVTKNGCAKLYVGCHAYTFHYAQRISGKKYWRCHRRKFCKGRLNQESNSFLVTTPHTCPPEPHLMPRAIREAPPQDTLPDDYEDEQEPGILALDSRLDDDEEPDLGLHYGGLDYYQDQE